MIKVFTGPMFSGKSLGLIQAAIQNKKEGIENIICFKPYQDTRDKNVIKSRDLDLILKAIPISDLSQIKCFITDDIDTILIDEAQFISGDTKELLWLTNNCDINIYIAGLDMTSEMTPFNIMPNLLAIADEVYKGKSICSECGKEASYTYCKVEKNEDILVGDTEEYIPVCGKCYFNLLSNKNRKQR